MQLFKVKENEMNEKLKGKSNWRISSMIAIGESAWLWYTRYTYVQTYFVFHALQLLCNKYVILLLK